MGVWGTCSPRHLLLDNGVAVAIVMPSRKYNAKAVVTTFLLFMLIRSNVVTKVQLVHLQQLLTPLLFTSRAALPLWQASACKLQLLTVSVM